MVKNDENRIGLASAAEENVATLEQGLGMTRGGGSPGLAISN